MLRPSVAPSRASHAPGSLNSHEYAAAAAQRLTEKKKEYEAVAALESASNLLLQRMGGISEDFDVMADAGRVHGQVLEQWPKMFQILSLFVSQRQQTEASQGEESTVSSNFEGQRLVRVPIDDLASEKH
ncbi:DASH complex subunit DAD2 [Pleurotus pulmonarius]